MQDVKAIEAINFRTYLCDELEKHLEDRWLDWQGELEAAMRKDMRTLLTGMFKELVANPFDVL